MQIFDKWGEWLLETTDNNKGADGTDKGKNVLQQFMWYDLI